MLNRLTVNALLKTVIAALSAAVMVMLASDAWDSWKRLQDINKIATVSEASGHLFTGLHNLRVDRASTTRDLNSDKQLTAIVPQLKEVREAEVPALKAALVALKAVDLPDRDAVISDLEQRVNKLVAMHAESAEAFLKPKAERRAGMSQEFFNHTNSLLETIDKLSSRLTRLIKLEDGYIDQLMEIKQLAWVVRNAGGDASVMISNTLGGQPLPAEPMLKYTANVSRAETAWAAIEDIAAGLTLPAKLTDAIARGKKEFFGQDYVDMRLTMLKSLIAGEKPKMETLQWTGITVPKLAFLLGVAEAALDTAKNHAAEQRLVAMRSLGILLGLLALSVAFAVGVMLLISRRVTGPLHTIQSAMLKLAGGDLTAEVAFVDRKDEIGALGGAMQAFKASMVEADRLRGEQKENEGRSAAQRKSDMQKLANEFQAAVGNIVDTVSTASTHLEAAAGTLTKTAETTQQLSGVVASASEEASANVESVASAAEEMTGSVNEIARQVQESSKIAGEAVSQAQKTDARITELSQAASRIGDVVKLITAIAEQTNLLALNATIEAARAGEAGKGFAVVAQEVKALASQTAKATDEIGAQIAAMQSATQDSVAAIKEIGGTIGRIAEIASTIAAAVEEQGAATQEIARNVQQAAQGTGKVATNITDVNRGASETGSASSQVLGSAQSLARESSRLKTEVEKFVQMVRAA